MKELIDESIMPFGSHKGKTLDTVPAQYLLWAYDNLNLQINLKKYIDDNRKVLEKEVSEKVISHHKPYTDR